VGIKRGNPETSGSRGDRKWLGRRRRAKALGELRGHEKTVQRSRQCEWRWVGAVLAVWNASRTEVWDKRGVTALTKECGVE